MTTYTVHDNFKTFFPRSAALGLAPISTTAGVDHAGADEDYVKAKLGVTRFNNLMAIVAAKSSVFSCGHRIKNGVEAHAIYFKDIESFLAAGG